MKAANFKKVHLPLFLLEVFSCNSGSCNLSTLKKGTFTSKILA